jgi:hypothetical protein
VLALAGIPEEACSVTALWQAKGWSSDNGYSCREPTAEERREALARLEVAD